MSNDRHSYVPFYSSDWVGGTSRMNPMQELTYFRICCYIWDKAEPVPDDDLPLMLGAIDGWAEILDQLIAARKLHRTPNGIINKKALAVAEESLRLWTKKSKGGKKGAKSRWKDKIEPKKINNNLDHGTPNDMSMGDPMDNHNHNHNQPTPNGVGRASHIPGGWKPSDKDVAYAIEKGILANDVESIAENFHEHWSNKSGKAGLKINWSMAFQTWVRKEIKFNGQKGQANGISPETESERSAERVARVIEADRQRYSEDLSGGT